MTSTSQPVAPRAGAVGWRSHSPIWYKAKVNGPRKNHESQLTHSANKGGSSHHHRLSSLLTMPMVTPRKRDDKQVDCRYKAKRGLATRMAKAVQTAGSHRLCPARWPAKSRTAASTVLKSALKITTRALPAGS